MVIKLKWQQSKLELKRTIHFIIVQWHSSAVQCGAARRNAIRSYVAHTKLIHRECRHRKILPFFHIWSLLKWRKTLFGISFEISSWCFITWSPTRLRPVRPSDNAFLSALLLFVIVHSLPETKLYSMMMVSIDLHCMVYCERKSNKTREKRALSHLQEMKKQKKTIFK